MSTSFRNIEDVEDIDGSQEAPVAGPSNWWRKLRYGRLGFQNAENDEEVMSLGGEKAGPVEKAKEGSGLKWTRKIQAPPPFLLDDRKGKRQATTSSSASPTSSVSSSSSFSTAPLFVPPPSTFTSSATATASGNTTSSFISGSPASSLPLSSVSSSSTSSPTRARSSGSSDSRTFTSLWSTTRSASASATPTYVPGVTFNLTLGGTRDDEAIYAVAVELGHGATAEAQANAYAWAGEEGEQGDLRREVWRGKRQVLDTGPGYQRVKLQVDLGSSDMWVAVTNCSTSDCTSAPAKFDSSLSISSGVRANMTYHSGAVSGEIIWEEVQLDRFAIAYQAFIAGDRVTNENLGGGDFSGVLGMALPANSIISSQIPGTTSSNPDGATFLDNLFGSGTFAPTQRVFSLALERREDVRTRSLLTIGSTYDRYCPAPCSPSYIPIIANPNLGVIGYLHWRVPLMGVMATDWSDGQLGSGPTEKTIPLGGSLVVSSRSQPLAVLDSGGVAILVGHKPYADAIYAAYGISASGDGYYRMPCKTQLSFSFNFGGKWYPAHPLDMSWPDPSDPSQSTCIGAIQYTPLPNDAGDFVFGSSFLKNVYSVFSYPDQARNSGTWQPGVALYSLTNASVSSQDFYAVRALRQSLAQVSSQGPFIGGSSPSSPSSTPSSSTGGGSVVNTTAIVAGSVVGFFVLAAAAFSAWFFFLKRKYGNTGYPLGRSRGGGGRDTPESEPATTFTRRTKKHQEAHRQKSMIEGYSDYEGDSWTEGGESVRLGYLPEVPEDGGMEGMRGKRVGSVGSSMAAAGMMREKSHAGSSLRDEVGAGGSYDEKDAIFQTTDSPASTPKGLPLAGSGRARSSSRPRQADAYRPDLSNFTYPPVSPTSPGFTAPLIYSQPLAAPISPAVGEPRSGSGSSGRRAPTRGSSSLSMSGPFPSATRHGLGDLDTSPMYEIRSADYFDVGEARGRKGSVAAGGAGIGDKERRQGSGSGSRDGLGA